MKLIKLIPLFFLLIFILPVAQASFDLNVKIDSIVGNEVVKIHKRIRADYNKEIIITDENLKNRLVVNLKRFDSIRSGRGSVSPVQVDIKLINEMQKIIGRPQTVTSFYNHTAQFAVHSSGSPSGPADINVSLNFEETN